MKLNTNTLVTKVALILAMTLILTGSASAQSASAKKFEFKKNAVENLILGIQSENDGLRKTSIYYAGKYQIDQTVDALIDALKDEKNSNLRILIALSLFRIGNDNGLDAVYDNAVSEKDPNVKRMCYAIVEEYKANKNVLVSTLN